VRGELALFVGEDISVTVFRARMWIGDHQGSVAAD
jgi:hypothetical protein